jgi:hypothetical protein
MRRNIGRQKLRPRRIIITLSVYSIISVLILIASQQHANLLPGYGGGLLLGGLLGFIGLRLTRFETTEEAHFYTPNTHIGVGLTLLLAGRMIYRFFPLNTAGGTPPPIFGPLTCFIIGLTFGYYVVYYIGLFVHTHDRKPDVDPNQATPPLLP